MRAVSPKRFPASVDELRRRLLEEFSETAPASPAPSGPGSQALTVLMDGFLQGSLLTLAVCTPKRRSLFSSQTAKQQKPFRTYIVSLPQSGEAVPAPADAERTVETTLVAR